MERPNDLNHRFVQKLLIWHKIENKRKMPWKGINDPYKIWLSEIILQQTRVEQGLKYYENFINTFPNINALANAPEVEVFKLWEGLGYYSRCRNLIATAKFISKELNGVFPSDYNSILSLKGIGPYTAAAIASFAYSLPYAVVDGNVFRVLSRFFNIALPADSTKGKKHFASLAADLLPENSPGVYNQAIMDFGATICKPAPLCNICPLNSDCQAYRYDTQDTLPVKEKKTKVKERWFNYVVLRHEDEVLIHQRTANDIWQLLFEFLLIESKQSQSAPFIIRQLNEQYGIFTFKPVHTKQVTQRLSHQLIHFKFIYLNLEAKQQINSFEWTNIRELENLAFPKTLHQYINEEVKTA